MPIAPSAIDELLEPISPDQPSGEDLRWTPEWDRIREARRADDDLSAGKWQRKEQKSADWRLVQQLTTAMLQKRSKDLQLAMWLTEANIKLQGFSGLRDGLQLTRELTIRFWDAGLFPAMEDGPQDRSGPFEWMNEKLVDSVIEVPITCSIRGEDFNLLQLRDTRLVGSEASWRDHDGEIDDEKKKAFDAALSIGRRSTDMFRAAVNDTERRDYEDLSSEFEAAHQEFKELDRLLENKFGDIAPSLKEIRAVLNEISQEVSDGLQKKRQQEPDSSVGNQKDKVTDNAVLSTGRSDAITIRLPLSGLSSGAGPSGTGMSWQEAERLVRTGDVDSGLADMIRLAASETSGRNRFQRKLLLAEVCLVSNRERLARAILEELAEQIDKFQLEAWETSEVVGGVWTRLYQIYKRGNSSDHDLATKLYDRLCRLDPWQALSCAE